jgi:PilZ domain
MDDKERRGAAAPQRPRSPRVPVEFAVEVEGIDSSGNPFNVKAQATKISHGGATIILDTDVTVGTVVKLTPPFGRQLEAEINGVWHDEMDGKQLIGVKLLADDGWFAD